MKTGLSDEVNELATRWHDKTTSLITRENQIEYECHSEQHSSARKM
jgi:hypothetical protein